MRVYCWRSGCGLEVEDRCPECGSRDHAPLEDQTRCGNYVAVTHNRGDGCTRPHGHEGKCSLKETT